MFLMSQIHPYILQKKVIMFKVTSAILSDFNSFQVILIKYKTDVVYVTHIKYITRNS